MLRPIIKFDTGLVIEANKDGFEVETPDGEYVEYDAYGMRKLQEDELGACVKVGDCIEHFPTNGYVVVSMMDSGYHEEQKIDIGNVTNWKVMKIEDTGNIFAVSAKSAGQLKLTGLAGYQNVAYILHEISIACTTDNVAAATLGYEWGAQARVYVDEITKVCRRHPYSDELYKSDVELIKPLDLKATNGIWLASRHLDIVNGDYYFGVNVLKNNGEVKPECLNKSYIAGCLDDKTACYDVFPVIVFPAWEKIESGAGTEDNPYKLEG